MSASRKLVMDVEPVAEAPRPAGDRMAQRLQAMRETLARRHAEQTLTIGSLARELGVSERTCHLAFAAAGTSFSRELSAIRLDRAYAALEADETAARHVGRLAERVGFSDLSYFHRRFKERFGTTPRAVRAKTASLSTASHESRET